MPSFPGLPRELRISVPRSQRLKPCWRNEMTYYLWVTEGFELDQIELLAYFLQHALDVRVKQGLHLLSSESVSIAITALRKGIGPTL